MSNISDADPSCFHLLVFKDVCIIIYSYLLVIIGRVRNILYSVKGCVKGFPLAIVL